MRKISGLFILVFLLPLTGVSGQNSAADDILGTWLNADKDAHIKIYKERGEYFGKIIWLKTPIDPETGKPKLDKENPDPKLRSRKTLGLVILKDFVFDDDEWEDGSIYDPKSGKTYNSYMKLENKDKLAVRGYIGRSWMGLGRTTEWTRVKEQ